MKPPPPNTVIITQYHFYQLQLTKHTAKYACKYVIPKNTSHLQHSAVLNNN